MNFGQPAGDFRHGPRRTGRVPAQQPDFKGFHVLRDKSRRRPSETVFRDIHRSVLPCPLVDTAKPIFVHPTEELCREPRLWRKFFHKRGLCLEQNIILCTVHIPLALYPQCVPQHAPARAAFSLGFRALRRLILG